MLPPSDSDYYLWGLFENVTVQALTTGPVIALSLAFLLLFVSGFVSASEVTFFSLIPGDLDKVGEENRPADPVVKRLLERSEYLLALILIASNFVNVAIVMLCTYVINTWINFSAAPLLGFMLETILLILLLLLFGKTMPRIYAQKNPLRFVRFSTSVLSGLGRFCRPFPKTLVNSTPVINKALAKEKYGIFIDELSKALELVSTEIPEKKEMPAEVVKFYNKIADETMTSCLDMEDIGIKISFRGVVDFTIKFDYLCTLVYPETKDNIEGVLYIKDLLPYTGKPDTFRWQGLIRPAYFMSETKKIDDLLEEFHIDKIHMAVAVGEFGGTSGIVTTKDILEEIVGEISDEYDEDEQRFIRLADGGLIFEAKILLTDFFRVIDTDPSDFGKLTEEVETLAGLLLEIKGGFPRRREVADFKEYYSQVLKVDNRGILKVKFNRILEGTGNDENGKDMKQMFMKWIAAVIGDSLFLGICCISCVEHVPKPRGCVRIESSRAQYKLLGPNCLSFNFDIPQTAVIEVPDQRKGAADLNISYSGLEARFYCSYLPITPASLVTVETESHSLVARLIKSGNRISERAYPSLAANVYDPLFLLDGEPVSSTQFLLTDSISNFFRGILYSDCKPNADLLAPAIQHIQKDIIELVQTFSWRE